MNEWPLAELVEFAARALAADDVRVASGRVNEVPNERLARWYSTIGLLDRPAIGRGRTARYGQRHLAQLVAIKRLQAQGLPLADIQQRLVGATDEDLRQIADLPAELPPAATSVGGPDNKLRVGAQTSVHTVEVDDVAEPPALAGAGGSDAGRPTAAPGASVRPSPGAFWEERPRRQPDRPAPVHGVRLSGLTLLLAAQPGPDDLDAIAVAAAPLIDLLASRGLLEPKGSRQ